MSEVVFEQSEESKKFTAQMHADASGSKMGNFLVKNKIAKDARQANVILLGISVLFFALMFFVFSQYVFASPTPQTTISPQDAKIIKGYISQGLHGRDLTEKVKQAKALGIIK
jgi:hypothetical protein